ncbi:MAG: hypothetical protein AAFO69_07360 [Bacteroidota bacterium]
MKEHYANISLKAPYFTLNELTEQTKRVWLVCHGYGQLVRYFHRKFKVLDAEDNFLIFPQGLSKFYLPGHQRVGATWMTKEDRLTEIENQYIYLDRVLEEALGEDFEGELSKLEFHFFGFSQGVATILRYAAYRRLPIKRLILWAGGIPPELSSKDFDFLPADASAHLLLGDKDQYYTSEAYREHVIKAKEMMGNAVQFTIFNGGHDVIPEVLQQL